MKLTYILLLVTIIAGAARADDLQHRPRYTLRPGDVLTLKYRYTPELDQTVTVLPDGYVNLNLVGDMMVNNLTLEQAHDLIIQKASEHLVNPELNIVLTQFQQPYVVVAGEVARPGKIDLREDTTAMQAVMLSGGFSEDAKSGQVILFRRINADSAEVRVLNLRKMKKTSDLERDVALQPGDMLYIPRDHIENISRIMKTANLGMYFNPIQP